VDGGPSDAELLLASVHQEISALKGDRRLREPGDGNRGRALYQHVLDLIGAAEHQLKKDPTEDAPGEIQESFDRLLRSLLQTLRSAHAAMPWLAGTRNPQINLGTLYFAEECAEILVGKSVDLVVVPDPEYMYSAQSWPFRRVVNKVSGFLPQATNRPVILRYPLSDDNRLLLHSIFSHELGHPAVQEFGLVAEALEKMEADGQFEAELEKTAGEVFPAVSSSTRAKTLRQWLRSWAEEAICDHLAIGVAGPAYLWAFAGFVMPLSYDSPSPSHPPNTVRVNLMLEQLTAHEWDPYLQERAGGLLRWLEDVGANAKSDMEPPFDFLRDQLLRHGALCREIAKKVIGHNRLAPAVTVREADSAEKLLDDLILPVGEDPVLEPRGILLGGWQRALAAHGGTASGIVSSLADRQLQDLVGKAIELSVVASCWEDE
jgi:hypothetical protein